MTHPFSLAYLTVPGLTPPEQTYVAAKAGYEHVSFRLAHLGVPGEPDIDPTSKRIIRETKEALAATDVTCFDIELIRILRGVEPTSFVSAFEAGAELGARHVICSAWTDVRNDRSFVVDKFSEICELARSFDLVVSLEFPAFSRLTTLEEVVEILELARAPNSGVLIDTLYMHFNRCPMTALQKIAPHWVHFMHICDAEDVSYTKEEMIHTARDARLYIGDGAIDFSQINDAYPDLPLSIELPNAKQSETLGHQEHARLCLESARAVLNNQQHETGGTRRTDSRVREETYVQRN